MAYPEEYIDKCLENNRPFQEKLYHTFAPKMYGLCMRFAKSAEEAEDILQEGFIKVFLRLKDFRREGSLEGWIRRIMVNTAINYYKRKLPSLQELNYEHFDTLKVETETIVENISVKELHRLIQDLPLKYRQVFKMNAIQGYTHKEIGEILNISDNTSKSRLTRARTLLQDRLSTISGINPAFSMGSCMS